MIRAAENGAKKALGDKSLMSDDATEYTHRDWSSQHVGEATLEEVSIN